MKPTHLLTRVATFAAAAALFLFSPQVAYSAPSPASRGANLPAPPPVTAASAVLIDADTGQVLAAKNAEQRREPASTTKVLTALVALREGNLQAIVTTSERAWGLEGSSAYLEIGEQQSLENMLYALLLPSGNDAAAAIAEHIAGSNEAFAQRMNAVAADAGATSSHFSNPHGLPARDHYTTALDLARITRVALQDQTFARIVRTRSFDLPGGRQERLFYNHNKLLWRYDGATGVKTGYTQQAGYTLVASAERDGRRLVAVLMDADKEGIWRDAAKLFDFGFSLPDPTEVVSGGQVTTEIPLDPKGRRTVPIAAAHSLNLYLGPQDAPELEQKTDLPETLTAPIDAGQKVGRLEVVLRGQVLGGVDLVAAVPVPLQTPSFFGRLFEALPGALAATARGLGLLLAFLLSLFGLLVLRAQVLRRRQRHAWPRFGRRKSRYGGGDDYLPLHRVIRRNMWH